MGVIIGVPACFTAYMVACFLWGISPQSRTLENLAISVVSGVFWGLVLAMAYILVKEGVQRRKRVAEIMRQNEAKKKRDAEKEAAKQGGASVAR